MSYLNIFYVSVFLMLSALMISLSNFMLMSLIKIILMRSHFLVVLLVFEAVMVLVYTTMANTISSSNSSSSILFLFMVIMVMGASVGLAMIALITRGMSKEMDFVLVK